MKILLIEDSESDAALIQTCLAEASDPIDTVRVVDLASAQTLLTTFVPDCLLVDLGLPDAVNLEAVDSLAVTLPHVPLVVITGRSDDQTGVQAVARGAQDYLTKDALTAESLERAVRFAIERSDAMRRRVARARRAQSHELLESIAAQVALAQDGLSDSDDLPELLTKLAATVDRLRATIEAPPVRHEPIEGGGPPVALRPVVDRALTLLADDITRSEAEIVVGRLPTLWCDANTLLEIMLQLVRASLGTARRPARVRISASWDIDAWIVEVADNSRHPDIRAEFAGLQRVGMATGLGAHASVDAVESVLKEQGGMLWTTRSDLGGRAVRFRLPGAAGLDG